MAKKDSDKASKEEIKEQKELEKQQMLKSKLRKKRMNQKIAKEEKRIKDIINLPFKILSISAFILTLLSFIVFYFWMNIDLKYSLLYAFYIFCILYLGVGIVIASIFFIISSNKKHELEEEIRMEEEKRMEEDRKREEEETAELEALEREIALRRASSKQPETIELPKNEESVTSSKPQGRDEIDEDSYNDYNILDESTAENDAKEDKVLEQSTESKEMNNIETTPVVQPKKQEKDVKPSKSDKNQEKSYLEEIMDYDFDKD